MHHPARPPRRDLALATAALATVLCLGCATAGATAVVSVKLSRTEATPRDASVYVDEAYVAPLYVVIAHGGLLPVGEHRVSVVKEGYFPYDALVEANRRPITLRVDMERVPD